MDRARPLAGRHAGTAADRGPSRALALAGDEAEALAANLAGVGDTGAVAVGRPEWADALPVRADRVRHGAALVAAAAMLLIESGVDAGAVAVGGAARADAGARSRVENRSGSAVGHAPPAAQRRPRGAGLARAVGGAVGPILLGATIGRRLATLTEAFAARRGETVTLFAERQQPTHRSADQAAQHRPARYTGRQRSGRVVEPLSIHDRPPQTERRAVVARHATASVPRWTIMEADGWQRIARSYVFLGSPFRHGITYLLRSASNEPRRAVSGRGWVRSLWRVCGDRIPEQDDRQGPPGTSPAAPRALRPRRAARRTGPRSRPRPRCCRR